MKVPEQYRIKDGNLGTDASYGNNGCFLIPFESVKLEVIASDGLDWDHVSIALNNRTPNWREMCFIKELFWGDDAWVVEYHPPKSEYVNNHPNCLHLWRPQKENLPTPDKIMV